MRDCSNLSKMRCIEQPGFRSYVNLSLPIDWSGYWFKGAERWKMMCLVCWWKHFATHFAIQHGWAIWDVFFCECWKKLLCLDVFLCSALSCDSTCLAPCCECSHWAVITHLSADWNIHSQVSPSLGVAHMDSLLSPPSALTLRHSLPPAFCCTSLCSQRLATPLHNHPELSLPWALNATVPFYIDFLPFSLFLFRQS